MNTIYFDQMSLDELSWKRFLLATCSSAMTASIITPFNVSLSVIYNCGFWLFYKEVSIGYLFNTGYFWNFAFSLTYSCEKLLKTLLKRMKKETDQWFLCSLISKMWTLLHVISMKGKKLACLHADFPVDIALVEHIKEVAGQPTPMKVSLRNTAADILTIPFAFKVGTLFPDALLSGFSRLIMVFPLDIMGRTAECNLYIPRECHTKFPHSQSIHALSDSCIYDELEDWDYWEKAIIATMTTLFKSMAKELTIISAARRDLTIQGVPITSQTEVSP